MNDCTRCTHLWCVDIQMETIFVEFIVAKVRELNGGEGRVLDAGVASLVRDEHVGPHVGLLWRLETGAQ